VEASEGSGKARRRRKAQEGSYDNRSCSDSVHEVGEPPYNPTIAMQSIPLLARLREPVDTQPTDMT
jgi:hypothetical protein